MKITCLSDTHGRHEEVLVPEDTDLLLFAGDAGTWGTEKEMYAFNNWLGKQPGHKIVIAGNHDRCFEGLRGESLFTNATYLQDTFTGFDGLKIYGSPWQPEFCNWAFNLPRDGEELKRKWDNITNDVDVLITHGPPQGTLDQFECREYVGDRLLRNRIAALPNLKLHVFGHIHSAYGHVYRNGVHSVNACICNEAYYPANQPITLEL